MRLTPASRFTETFVGCNPSDSLTVTSQAFHKPVRLLLLGCGQIGKLHASRLTANPAAQILACCDPVRNAAESVVREHARFATAFDDLETALRSTPLDAAVICTPTGQHFAQVNELRGRGMPVLCEKPLADSRQRICELVDSSTQGPLLSIAYQRRYSAAFRTLRREVLSGRYGPVRSVLVQSCERWGQTIKGTWRNDPQQNPGGFLGDAGSHKIDMVFFVTGLSPVAVYARSQKRDCQVDVVTHVSALLTGDVPFALSCVGDAQHFSEEFWIHCAAADLVVRDGGVYRACGNLLEPITLLEPESDPDTAFIQCLTAGAENLAPPEIALPVWDFTFAALESARTGQAVTLT